MDETAALTRDNSNPESPAIEGWEASQTARAAAASLSVLLIAGHQPPSLLESNNNSICRAFQSSNEHAALCEPYCGQAFARAMKAGAAIHYRCHAGLHCFAMPVKLGDTQPLAIIGGRAFLKSADYRALVERIRGGDLQSLLSSELFKNVVFASQQDLDELIRQLMSDVAAYENKNQEVKGYEAEDDSFKEKPVSGNQALSKWVEPATKKISDVRTHTTLDSYFPLDKTFSDANLSALESFGEKHSLSTIALFRCEKKALVFWQGTGRLKTSPLLVDFESEELRACRNAKSISALALIEEGGGFKLLARNSLIEGQPSQTSAELFPLIIGEQVEGALVIADDVLNDEQRKAVQIFCREMTMRLEVFRLRLELAQRARVADYLQSFSARINSVEPAATYTSIMEQSAELLKAERGSLLLYDEASNELAVKASLGMRAEVATNARQRLGEGISGGVMDDERPLVVRDLVMAGRTPAPLERHYKTKSFISYPIMIGGRKVGVLNVTDKAGGGSYDEVDLSLIDIIAPQMAMALDRAEWCEKAAQFQLMSITDPLTGLLNRRYLEERLTEEANRSKRHGYAMSFMMIDIDDFKIYNDRNGHQAGDLALEMTAQCLKSALRSADVASRYGGEEFCILLPQTPLEEALAIAERIRRRVERTRYPNGDTQPLGAVTVSIGLAVSSPILDTSKAIIGAADKSLYLAKNQGKNRVHTSEKSLTEAPIRNVASEFSE
jgi:diguanylate cyclase (GGDEF)-like protein